MTLLLHELIAEMEAGLERMTPGKWVAEIDLPYGEHPRVETTNKLIAVVGNAETDVQDEWGANAAHIARCSPDNIAAIIAGYRQIQEENAGLRKDIGACHATFAKPIDILNDRVDARDAEISALKALLREALAALEPFANFCEKAERFVEGRANFGGSPIRPVKDFRLSHFQAARFVAARIKKELPDGE